MRVPSEKFGLGQAYLKLAYWKGSSTLAGGPYARCRYPIWVAHNPRTGPVRWPDICN